MNARGRRGIARLELLRQLKDRPCADCGGRFPHYVMEFDHVRGAKVLPVAMMKYYRLDRLLAEIAKCDLVCSNCHAIRTHERGQYRPTQIDPAAGVDEQIALPIGGSR